MKYLSQERGRGEMETWEQIMAESKELKSLLMKVKEVSE